jgi:hypothetical protein
LTFGGSIAGGAGIGVIGSSAVVLFDSIDCPSGCDGTGESCKPNKINAQIVVDQRERRTIPHSTEVGNWGKNSLIDIFSELLKAVILRDTMTSLLSPTSGIRLQQRLKLEMRFLRRNADAH